MSTHTHTNTDIHNTHLLQLSLSLFFFPLAHTHTHKLQAQPPSLPPSDFFFFTPCLSLNSTSPLYTPHTSTPPSAWSGLVLHSPSTPPLSPFSPPSLCVKQMGLESRRSLCSLYLRISSAFEWCKPDGNTLWPTVSARRRLNEKVNADADNLSVRVVKVDGVVLPHR